MIDNAAMDHLRRCVELAAEALALGDEPFGSVLVGPDGVVLMEDHNRVAGGDGTRHPELEIARWAAASLPPDQRAASTVYTSGEHCPMCSAAHAWAGLGRIVYVASAQQIRQWKEEFGGGGASPVRPLPIHEVAPGIPVEGPVPELADGVRELVRRWMLR